MQYSKIKDSNFYQNLRRNFLFSFLRNIYYSLSPWHLFNRIKKLEKEVEFLYLKDKNIFLKDVKGVIHVGANLGQERYLYDSYSKHVLWFEPIPSIFNLLQKNLKNFPDQKAYQLLITDKDRKHYDFHITNNYQSSSIFELKLHKSMWPGVRPLQKISLESITLDTFFYKNKINIQKYDTLIMDTQGSELLVLHGSENILKNIKYIKTEAADYESYKDCYQLKDIDDFLTKKGFKMIEKICFKSHKVGNYYDVLFIKE